MIGFASRAEEDRFTGGHRVARHLEHHDELDQHADREEPADVRAEHDDQARPQVGLAEADAERDEDHRRPDDVRRHRRLRQLADRHRRQLAGVPRAIDSRFVHRDRAWRAVVCSSHSSPVP
jgi:hypothetical protein